MSFRTDHLRASRRIIVLFLALSLTFAFSGFGTAVAQTVSVRGNVGAAFFRSPEIQRKILNSGSSLGLGADVQMTQEFALTVEATYNGFTLNEDNARIRGRTGSDRSFVGGAAGFRYTFTNSSDAHPYAAVSGGVYQVRTSNHRRPNGGDELVSADRSSRDIQEAMHLALGSEIRISDVYAVFLEPRYAFFNIGEGIGGAERYFTVRLGLDAKL